MVKIRIGAQEATIDGYKWQTDDPTLLALLNSFFPWHGPGGADPHPDLTVATMVVEALGGEILEADPVEHVPGRVY